jgi:hypothetical protein
MMLTSRSVQAGRYARGVFQCCDGGGRNPDIDHIAADGGFIFQTI